MIRDPLVLAQAREAWEFIRDSRNVIVGNCNVATIAVGFNQARIRDLCFNLLLASALSVLEDVLRQARDERSFVCKHNQLGRLMQASVNVVPWINYAAIDTAREDRNRSIHERSYIPHGQCRDYIAAIENELFAWGVLQCTTPKLWHW